MYKVGIIGLGLIGGSMAIDLKRRGFASEVSGVDADKVNASAALKIGLVDRVLSLEECVDVSDLIVLAVPVGAARSLLLTVLDRIESEGLTGKTVTDVCSIKRDLSEMVSGHPARGRYVSGHPMSGTEYSGPWAAMSGLFDGKACVICDSGKSSPDALGIVEKMYDILNMRHIYMDSSSHDMHAAYVSHISHITSFALALTVLQQEKNDRHIFDLASGGFSSTVRLAKSNSDMWVPILSGNRENILEVIDTYMEKMLAFRNAIASGDEQKTESLIKESNRIRRIIR